MAGPEHPVHGMVDHLFRHESGRMVARLTRALGPAHLPLVEEVVQEALIQALRTWPFHGVPDRPEAWLQRVARNLALDRLRRDSTFRGKETAIREAWGQDRVEARTGAFPGEVTDDSLRLVFLCCHPELPRDARVALTLKTVGGFGVPEIARAFRATPATIAQRLVRAQRRIREQALPFELPGPAGLPERLDAVLEVLYLMFNEGYTAHDGTDLVRVDLCREAIRLVTLLSKMPPTDRPEVHALAALLHFQASRLGARVDARGNLVPLDQQDRSAWSAPAIRTGFRHLERAAGGDRESTYHLEAAIAACHASSAGAAGTDWNAILSLYDRLAERNPSPIVALNRAVAVARTRGPEAALAELSRIADHPAVQDYHLLHATRADLLESTGRIDAAREAWRRALACPCSDPERRFLLRRLNGI